MLSIELLEQSELRIRSREGVRQIFDPVRKKWLVLTPEEHLRQVWIQYLTVQMQYPPALIAVEKQIRSGTRIKRFDIIVYNRKLEPWLLAEFKAPGVAVSRQTLYQLLQYQQHAQCRYWLISNGVASFCADAADPLNVRWLSSLPLFEDL